MSHRCGFDINLASKLGHSKTDGMKVAEINLMFLMQRQHLLYFRFAFPY